MTKRVFTFTVRTVGGFEQKHTHEAEDEFDAEETKTIQACWKNIQKAFKGNARWVFLHYPTAVYKSTHIVSVTLHYDELPEEIAQEMREDWPGLGPGRSQ